MGKKRYTSKDLKPGVSFRLFRERWHYVADAYEGDTRLIICKTWLRRKCYYAYSVHPDYIWDIDLEYAKQFRRKKICE